jgi:hypothetical protein
MSGKVLRITALLAILALAYTFAALNRGEYVAPNGLFNYGRTPQDFSRIRQSAFLKDTSYGDSSVSFIRNRNNSGYLLKYGWTDYTGKIRSISLTVTDTALANTWNSFGISSSSRNSYYQEHFKPFLAQRPDLEEIAGVIQQHKGPILFEDYHLVKPWQIDQFKEKCSEFENAYLQSRGFCRRNSMVVLDYSEIVRTHHDLMRPTAISFAALGDSAGMNLALLVHSIMAFTQLMPYKIPPLSQGDCRIDGLWPPLQTLVAGEGDCDTKAVFFSSIVNNYSGMETIIITVPGHAFNGIVGWHKRLPTDFIMSYGGHDALLVDLTDVSGFQTAGAIHEFDRGYLRNRDPDVYPTK